MTEIEAVQRASRVVEAARSIRVHGFDYPLGEPRLTEQGPTSRSYVEFAVHPHGIGYGAPGPPAPMPAQNLTTEDLTSAADQLYDLLRLFDSYDAAIVGWDPEGLVDVNELRLDWIPYGDSDGLDGLVVSGALRDEWEHIARWEQFAAEHWWIPHRGRRNAW